MNREIDPYSLREKNNKRHVMFRKFVGSVLLGSDNNKVLPGSTRFGLRFSDASWLGPVRFGSVPRPIPAGSRIKRFGLVRFLNIAS